MYNATAHLGELYAPGRQLCLYPSCGNRFLSQLLRLRSDVFVFLDDYPRSPAGRRKFWGGLVEEFSRNWVPLTLYKATPSVRVARSCGKWVFLFFLDNNAVLKRIARAGWEIAQFVGFNDGCREGGNYERVHEALFLGKLLPRMQPGADYFTDHSDLLSHPNPPCSIRTHTLFKTHFQHASGRELYLGRILIIRDTKRPRAGSESRSQPEVFEPPLRDAASRPPTWPEIGKAAAIELEKLSPFRTVGHTGIIAH